MYAIVALTLILLVSLWYAWMRPSLMDMKSPYKVPETSQALSITWADYLKDCGGEQIVENFIHARSLFNRNYEHNTVEWTGYLYEAKPVESLIPASWFDDLAYTVSIKMWPSESHLHPDIVLSVPYTVAEATQIPDFTELAKGSEIKFKGMF